MKTFYPNEHLQQITDFLESIIRKHNIANYLYRRAKILLLINTYTNNSYIAGKVGCSYKTVIRWRLRTYELFSNLSEDTSELSDALLIQMLENKPRSGSPPKFTPEQICLIIKIALEKPEDSQRPISCWTGREISEEAIKRNIVENISTSTVSNLLRKIDIRPHKSRYWLNPKINDEANFRKEIKEICDIYENVKKLKEENTIVVSIDEKTGMQATERIAPDKPVIKGHVAKLEFEYKRHGTQCLIPSFDVLTGKILNHYIGFTRTEDDFVEHVKNTVNISPDSNWIMVMDQLYTHKSEGLVRLFAEINGYKGDLGKKRKKGILENQKTRTEFLTKINQKIRIQFTPKHCSWMNQIEIWFGIFHRKTLNRKSFKSIKELVQRTKAFIEYYNNTMAKPFKWTYKGKPLMV